LASPNISEILTTTLENRQAETADNVVNSNALLFHLNKKGNVKPANGGTSIYQPLMYAENSTFQRYSGLELLNTDASDVISAAEYDWRQAAVQVIASGLETEVINRGECEVIDLLETRILVAEKTMANNISSDIYSDGSADNQIDGLQAQVAVSPTSGTVGGIDRSSFTFWRNQVESNADVSATTIEAYMKQLWIACIRGNDHTTLITADANTYEWFWTALSSYQRIMHDETNAQEGWEKLSFRGTPVVYDGDSGHPSSYMYFLNTDYIFFRPSPNRNFAPLRRREPHNQDGVVVPLVFAGNLTMSNASLQGVLRDTA
jgi:hypothetical protein